jgi:ERF superfamily protein
MTDKIAVVAPSRLDPQALLAVAVEKNATIETLERLVTLAKDVRQVTAREAWYEAMAQFQQKCPPILKSKTAKIVTARGSYSYSYSPLDEILSVVLPILGELGLSVSWRQKMEPNAVHVSCVVAHKLGHQEESGFIAMPYGSDGRMNPAQAVGSALTYARRYSLLAILGLAPEDDDDAQGSEGGGRGGTDPNPRTMARDGSPEPRTEGAIGPRGNIAPADPEDPALVRESEELFQDPEKQQLIEQCGSFIKNALASKKITQKDVRAMKATYLGAEDADPTKCDKAALSDLHTYLASRFGA